MLKYKEYFGDVIYDDEAKIFHGEIINTKSVITFQGTSVQEIEKAFKDSIDDYLDWCKERNKEPEKPFSGKFVLRISPELHREISLNAKNKHTSINSFIVKTLEKEISSHHY
jgi:predicted HicB family RNase H-like nuclease